jgi:L-seryl-tRNA(Ser) seleniumtransferase
VKTEIHVPPHANHVPSLYIRWDAKEVGISTDEMRKKLRDGHPSIETVGNKEQVGITTWMMEPGQERIVAQRVKEVLENA